MRETVQLEVSVAGLRLQPLPPSNACVSGDGTVGDAHANEVRIPSAEPTTVGGGAAAGGDERVGEAGADGSVVEGSALEWVELRHERLSAVNTEHEPRQVHPRRRGGATVSAGDGAVRAALSPASWNMIRVKVRSDAAVVLG